MRALVVYTSWFGHTRLIANALAEELEGHGLQVVCAPIDKIEPSEVIGFGLMLIGSHTHTGHASRRLVDFVEAIPIRRLSKMLVGVFGTTDRADDLDHHTELVTALAERGCEPVQPTLTFIRAGGSAILPERELDPADRARIREYAAEMAELAMPVQIG